MATLNQVDPGNNMVKEAKALTQLQQRGTGLVNTQLPDLSNIQRSNNDTYYTPSNLRTKQEASKEIPDNEVADVANKVRQNLPVTTPNDITAQDLFPGMNRQVMGPGVAGIPTVAAQGLLFPMGLSMKIRSAYDQAKKEQQADLQSGYNPNLVVTNDPIFNKNYLDGTMGFYQKAVEFAKENNIKGGGAAVMKEHGDKIKDDYGRSFYEYDREMKTIISSLEDAKLKAQKVVDNEDGTYYSDETRILAKEILNYQLHDIDPKTLSHINSAIGTLNGFRNIDEWTKENVKNLGIMETVRRKTMTGEEFNAQDIATLKGTKFYKMDAQGDGFEFDEEGFKKWSDDIIKNSSYKGEGAPDVEYLRSKLRDALGAKQSFKVGTNMLKSGSDDEPLKFVPNTTQITYNIRENLNTEGDETMHYMKPKASVDFPSGYAAVGSNGESYIVKGIHWFDMDQFAWEFPHKVDYNGLTNIPFAMVSDANSDDERVTYYPVGSLGLSNNEAWQKNNGDTQIQAMTKSLEESDAQSRVSNTKNDRLSNVGVTGRTQNAPTINKPTETSQPEVVPERTDTIISRVGGLFPQSNPTDTVEQQAPEQQVNLDDDFLKSIGATMRNN